MNKLRSTAIIIKSILPVNVMTCVLVEI